MDIQKAIEVLRGFNEDLIQEDGNLSCIIANYVDWGREDDEVVLDGSFSAEMLEALALYIRIFKKG